MRNAYNWEYKIDTEPFENIALLEKQGWEYKMVGKIFGKENHDWYF